MHGYAVDLLRRMVETYSPSGREKRLAHLISDELNSQGFEVERDSVGNVIGRMAREDPTILLCGHMDTVPGLIPVRIEGDKLYGRGSVDAKAPLAMMIVAASQLAKDGYEGSLAVVGTVDEEGKGRGIKHLAEANLDHDYAIFGEPTNVRTLTIGYKGNVLLRLACETETGHSSAPWQFQNAIEEAFEIWRHVKNARWPTETSGSWFNSVTACMRGIQGGSVASVVPSRCEIQVDFRIPPGITVDEFQNRIFALLEEHQTHREGVHIEVEIEDFTPAYVADKTSLLVRALSLTIWEMFGNPAKLVYKTGTGDMNLFAQSTGKPTVTYGPGDSHLDHTGNEHVLIGDYLHSIEALVRSIRKLRELHQKSTRRS